MSAETAGEIQPIPEGLLAGIPETIAEGIIVVDSGGHIAYANPAAEGILGVDRALIIGLPYAARPWTQYTLDGRPYPEEEVPLVRTIRTDWPVSNAEYVIGRPDGRRVVVSVNTSPLHDAEGRCVSAAASFTDITERKHHELLSDALDEINSAMNASLDFHQIVHQVVGESAAAIGAESATIAMRKENNEWIVGATHGLPPRLVGRCLATQETMPFVAPGSISDIVIVRDARKDESVDQDFVQSTGCRSMLGVPLIARGRLIGAILFANRSAPIPFDEIQIDFAAKLAPALSLALENARLYEEQYSIAEALQRSLIPAVPDILHLDIAVAFKSAFEAQRVGGDFYDIFRLDDGRVVAVIGDVSGKGAEAAGMTETIRSSIRTLAYIDPSPGFVVTRANEALLRQIGQGHFVTAVYAVIDPATGDLQLACAGHPPPVICGHDCAILEPLSGPPLGVTSISYESSSHVLGEGDGIILYTDGLTEARRGRALFGEERLLDAVLAVRSAGSRKVVEYLLGSATAFAHGRLADDAAVVAIRRC